MHERYSFPDHCNEFVQMLESLFLAGLLADEAYAVHHYDVERAKEMRQKILDEQYRIFVKNDDDEKE